MPDTNCLYRIINREEATQSGISLNEGVILAEIPTRSNPVVLNALTEAGLKITFNNIPQIHAPQGQNPQWRIGIITTEQARVEQILEKTLSAAA